MEIEDDLAPRVLVETMSAGGEEADPKAPGPDPGEARAEVPDSEEASDEETPDEALDPAAEGPETPFEDSDEELERNLAALLFASPDPLSETRLRGLLGGAPAARVQGALMALSARLREAGLPWELRPIAGGWQLFTTPDMAETVSLLSKVKKDEKVSPAALETLAVVAYRQPVTKADVEAIRGVQVGPILRALVDRNLIKVAGRAEVPGHPLLYATTKRFLDSFGLSSLEDLPRDGELLGDS